ncbi:MAG: hypothetical protein GVY11_04440, partial [Gammaproteobacteria bacterium]|nr:hypothetical protein [Gammaproteobacteria bacterium]
MSWPKRLRIATLAGLLMAPAVLASDPPEVPSRTLPFECEAWTEQVEALKASENQLERELGELHAEPDLSYCQTRRVRLDDEPDEESDWDLDLPDLRILTELARWLIIAVLAAVVVWLLWRWRRHRSAKRDFDDRDSGPAMPVQHTAAESDGALPDDIPAAAAAAWQAGRFRSAISLL